MERPTIAVATWNAQWSPLTGKRGPLVRARLREFDSDIIVLTEGQRGLLPEDGYVVDAGDDWGYSAPAHRRKTMVWCRWPLTSTVQIATGAGNGRVVLARADSPFGQVLVLGVCIPWASAHVATGRKDATTWSEHLECCDQVDDLVAGLDPRIPTVVAGDFNQRIPRFRQPKRVSDRLAEVMSRYTIHTAGDTDQGLLIDHIGSNVECVDSRAWSRSVDGVDLSDHIGVSCQLRL